MGEQHVLHLRHAVPQRLDQVLEGHRRSLRKRERGMA